MCLGKFLVVAKWRQFQGVVTGSLLMFSESYEIIFHMAIEKLVLLVT